MKALILQHVSFESPAAILAWLHENAFETTYIHLWENNKMPPVSDFDWLIIMGGPMSVNDEQELLWLKHEKMFIKECIENGKVVIGICLGAQLIASALGCKVYQGGNKEIGWYPLHSLNPTYIPDDLTVFHWHGETFDLPDNAKLLASTVACKNQVFKIGQNVLGMQCHLEMTPEAITGMVENCADELKPAPLIQSIAEIKNGTLKYYERANQVLYSLMNSIKLQN